MDTASLRDLFTKPYGAPAPTQERQGIAAYMAAQEGLIQRCDDSPIMMNSRSTADLTARLLRYSSNETPLMTSSIELQASRISCK